MNVGLYVRVSTAEQAKEGYSIGEQTARLGKYADAHDWTVYKTYTDGGYSGGDTNRPALQQMIRDIKAGRIKKVVVYKLDRLSRSQKDTLELIEDVFLENGVDFVSMNENFDTSTPFGRAIIGILAVFAQLEREQIKERMGMGKLARAKEGKWPGGKNVPFGYDYIDGELKINDYEAMIVREIFKMALEEKSSYTIEGELNRKGYKTKNASWGETSVRRALHNKAYIGQIKYGKEWFKGLQDPIIDYDTFFEVQEIMQKRSDHYNQSGRNPGKATTYLGGFLYCGCCGAKYTKNKTCSTKGGKRYEYNFFGCNTRHARGNRRRLKAGKTCKNRNWRVDVLTNQVFDQIKQLAIDPDYMHEVKSEPENNNDILIQEEIKKLDDQLSRFMDLYGIGQMPLDLLQKKVKDIDEQKLKLEEELHEIEREKEERLTHEQVKQIVKQFPDVLERGDFEEIRSIIGDIIEKIELKDDDITIYWRF